MMARVGWMLGLLGTVLCTGAGATPYTPPSIDPDWPCAQLLVPELTGFAYWDGPVPTGTAWRDDETLFTLVTAIVDRDTPDADALGKLNAYADGIPPDQRAKALPLLFSALVDQTNDERTLLISRIKQFGARQRHIGETIASISTKADDTAASDPRRADLIGQRDFDVHAFQEMQHTMRYACEAPANMERRLGIFARTLKDKLKPK